MKNIKAIIFDFDGTIADTMPFLTRIAVKLITEKYNVSKEEAEKRYLGTTGLDFASQIGIIFPNHPYNSEVVSIFELKKVEGIFDRPVFPDVVNTLVYLKKRKIKTFICSSTKYEIVMEYCKLRGIDSLLTNIFGYKTGFGKYDQINFIVRELSLEPFEMLFVGDSLKDCDFAARNKINFIGISRIFKTEDFQKKGVSSVNNLKDIIKILK